VGQLVTVSTLIEGISCDGSGGGGDGHIRTATAGGTAAVRSHYIYTKMKIFKFLQTYINTNTKRINGLENL
jgi:hypothetical protein